MTDCQVEDFARPVSSDSVLKVALLQEVVVLLVAPHDAKWAASVTSPTSSSLFLFVSPFFIFAFSLSPFSRSRFISVFGLSM